MLQNLQAAGNIKGQRKIAMIQNTMKNYRVKLCSGLNADIKAEIVTYDQAGNLIFMNTKKTLQTPENPDGQTLELVHCFNSRHYESYGPAPVMQ